MACQVRGGEGHLDFGCKMLVHNLDRDEARSAQGTRLQELEKEVSQLVKDAKTQDKLLKKAEEGKATAEKELKAERTRLKELEAEVGDLKKKNKSLTNDNSKISQGNDEAIEAAFTEGVNSYIATFLNG